MKAERVFWVRRIIFGMLMFAGVLMSGAEGGGGQWTTEDRAKFLSDRMKEVLVLKDEQYGAVYDVNLKYAKKADEVTAGAGGRWAKLRKLRSLQEEKDKDLKGFLTGDQYKKYEELKEQFKEAARERMQEKKQAEE